MGQKRAAPKNRGYIPIYPVALAAGAYSRANASAAPHRQPSPRQARLMAAGVACMVRVRVCRRAPSPPLRRSEPREDQARCAQPHHHPGVALAGAAQANEAPPSRQTAARLAPRCRRSLVAPPFGHRRRFHPARPAAAGRTSLLAHTRGRTRRTPPQRSHPAFGNLAETGQRRADVCTRSARAMCRRHLLNRRPKSLIQTPPARNVFARGACPCLV